MKHIRYTKLFGWLAAAALLLTTSCKDDMLFGNGSSDEVEVTFTLTPEAVASLNTRAQGDESNDGHVHYPDKGEYPHISDGSKADMLIYALYEKVKNEKGEDKYELLEGYSDGIDKELEDLGIKAGDGQTIKKIDKFPVTITLTLKRGSEYSIAFWAQNSKCKVYNTVDLRKVEVIYGEIDNSTDTPEKGDTPQPTDADDTPTFDTTTPNNDESRDAFCRSLRFTAGKDGLEQNVLLYRPLAQINVGTSGFDFESITRNSEKKYLYSKIRLNRVARYLDVVADKTITSTTNDNTYGDKDKDGAKTPESFAVADFGYAPLPAYINRPLKVNRIPEGDESDSEEKNTAMGEIEDNSIDYPKYPSYTIWDWDYPSFNNKEFYFRHADENITRRNYTGEEFLKVHLYDHDKIQAGDKDATGKVYNAIDIDSDGYWDYANLTDHDDELSETFKYLSMCYVLTSSTKEDAITINNVKVWLATDANGADEIEILDINHVPAQRNWRTNIVGNLLTEEATFSVTLDQNFAGEYNGLLYGDAAEWSGPLAKGVYYDAKNDEILISDLDGLLWFQKMVNGDLCVREAKVTSETGRAYPYYEYNKGTDEYEKARYLEKDDEWKGYQQEDYDETTAARILKATHQKEWPKHGNFPFCGEDGPAHVKLMADIDLKGIEWIPIGFDFKVHDGTVGTNKNYQYIDYKENGNPTVISGCQRVFRGVFDGNDHTIRNLSSKRFSIEVREEAFQAGDQGPYDNVQWFPAGFFGLVAGWGGTNEAGEQTTIKNLNMFNVDVYGCHTAAAIAAIVSSPENDCENNNKDYVVNITNCRVDVGTITLSPMHRGDQYSGRDRTFARGIYGGGIVGQFAAKGSITDCEVRGVTIRGYRQIGGLVGSISHSDFGSNVAEKLKKNITISGNRIYNSLVIADKFQPYDIIYNWVENGVWKNGFGWVKDQASLANVFVGGTESELYAKGNSKGDAQCVEFRTRATATSTTRKAEIGVVPLSYIPMLSSWFCDNITLTGNYYGETSVRVGRKYMDNFHPYTEHYKEETYSVPFQLPFNTSISYDENSPKAAMYVESVTLNGAGAIGGRSVITPDNLTDEGACVMYVTSRNRKQFFDNLNNSLNKDKFRYGSNNTKQFKDFPEDEEYIKSTTISNVVLRGTPYAHTGMLLSPNSNMKEVNLYNVAIYDVYRTLALDANHGDIDKTPDAGTSATKELPELTVENSNFRGYTVPGNAWKQITYTGTTFEEGTSTGHGTYERTYKVEAPTTFKECYFKAPYIIDLSSEKAKADFSEDQDKEFWTYATAASPKNKQITLADKEGCTHIVIESDAQGNPVVKYYKGSNLIKQE